MIKSMKLAVAYLRRSTDRQEQSLGDQRSAILSFANAGGFAVVHEYVDDAISGADTESRKQFLQMIADAQRPDCAFRHVFVYDVSRFGRVGADEAGYYRHLLAKAGVEVIYVAEGMRGDQTDDLLLGVKQYVAHQAIRDLSKVTIRGQVSRVNKGSWCGGRPPYGYDLQHCTSDGVPFETIRYLDNGAREVRDTEGNVMRVLRRGDRLGSTKSGSARLVLGDPVKVAVIRRIFEEYVRGEAGFGAIAERLNRDGIPSGARIGTAR
jgi:DNA invertase Pin-like site-specific DNA recombinase